MNERQTSSLRTGGGPRSLSARLSEWVSFELNVGGATRRIFRHDSWRIGIIRSGLPALLSDGIPHVEWLEIECLSGFVADPFIIDDKGSIYCFFEHLPYSTKRGKICYTVLDRPSPGKLSIHEAIAEPHHLSYPYLIRHDGEVICVPEASSTGCVEAYAARNFPNDWYRKGTLIDAFAGVDNTVFTHGSRWWLLATDARSGADSDLCIWFADDLFGHWQPHPANPVKKTLAGARPAGKPFVVDGKLYRPAQDCTKHYGHRLIINEILELSPERFRERAVSVIAPDPSGPCADGLHTANSLADVIVVDGNRFRFVPQLAARELASLGMHFGKRVLNRMRHCSFL